jgi:arginyl-tRNA synthetase
MNDHNLNLPEIIAKGLSALYAIEVAAPSITLQSTRKEFEGDYTFVVFPFTKPAGKSPEELGNELGSYIVTNEPLVVGYNVVKGFLNLLVADAYWTAELKKTIEKSDLGQFPATGKKVMVEYSSPNTNKPLHLGHLRTNFLGYAVSKILKAAGHDVVMANLVNDRGIHICKSMVAYIKAGASETPENTGMKGDKLVGKYYVYFDVAYQEEIKALIATGVDEEEAKKTAPIYVEAQELLRKWEAGDDATMTLWRTMNEWVYAGFAATYKRIGVEFDKYYYESNTYLLGKDVIDEGLLSQT